MDLLHERQACGPCSVVPGTHARRSRARGHHPRRGLVVVAIALAAAIAALPACTPPEPPEPRESVQQLPITVEVNQSRDQYGKQAIQLLLTNMSGSSLTVAGAQLASPLFQGDMLGEPAGGSLELPPNQPKSLPVRLPSPVCQGQTAGQQPTARVRYSEPGQAGLRETEPVAADPFRVLERNNAELCLASDAAAVADILLDPRLEAAADGSTAVVRLVITPKGTSTASNDAAGRPLTIGSIDGTTLIAEPAEEPWPRDVRIVQGAGRSELRLRIRPARCDPHAIAEDKVGTLLPLHVSVGGRTGLLKIPAGTTLRAQIYDFVAAACARG